jgi:hypothetical protein
MWGVPRREGHSDTDDPLAHAGLVQHAFLLGQDERALCGFAPPKRVSRTDMTARPQLALAGRDNPRCAKCTALVSATARAPQGDAEDSPDVSPEPMGGQEISADDPDLSGDPDDETADGSEPDAPRRRSSVRQGGRATVPAGRRSVVTEIPGRARGMAIAAQLEGAPHGLWVQSVTLQPDGTARIALNQRTDLPVDVVWFTVTGPATQS